MQAFIKPPNQDPNMAFFTYQDKLTNAKLLETLDLGEAGIAEDQLQALLAEQLQALDSEAQLMVIAREYGSWSDSTRRIDVLAIERTEDDARLVVVELKRTKDGGHAELQALRYAAMLSTHTFANVVDALHERRKGDPQATRETVELDLLKFLGKASADEVKLSTMPRIMLISQGFSTEITTTVMWLLEHTELDISCYTVALYPYGDGSKVLHFDLLLPLREQNDYLVKVRSKNVAEAQQQKAAVQRQQRACAILEAKDLLKTGTPLKMVFPPRPDMQLADSEKQAVYQGGGKVRWLHDQTDYSSLSKLTAHICHLHNQPVKSIQGTAHWGTDKGSLAEQAKGIAQSESI